MDLGYRLLGLGLLGLSAGLTCGTLYTVLTWLVRTW